MKTSSRIDKWFYAIFSLHTFIYKPVQYFCLVGLLLLSTHKLKSQISYPALRNVVKPSPEPGPPGDNFILPKISGTPNVNSPSCAEWTRTAGPDESLVITGINFSKYLGTAQGRDSRFKVYTKNGFVKEAAIQRLRDQETIITLDKSIPQWSMYLVWPYNEYGYGYPIAINKTDAWWIGPEKSTRGSIVSVFGRNLAFGNDTVTSNVYIKKADAIGQWATVTKVNPYKVDFVIPPTLSSGDYEVWVHNGHGGEYGWSGPLKLSILDDFQWNNTIINVKNYGAAGDGITDDFQPIKSAISAAAQIPGSTVYFPPGTYSVSNTVYLASNIKIKGAGNTNTVIKCGSNFSSNASGMINGNVTNFIMEDISFDTDGNFHGEHPNPIFLSGSSYVTIQNVKFFFQGFDVMSVNQGYRIFIKNCDIIGKISFLGNCSQVFIDSCTFKLTNDAELAINGWGEVGLCITNSTCQDFDNTNPNDGAGWGKGRFFSAIGNFGSSRFTYIGNNNTKDLAVRPSNDVDQNSGEQFLWEGFASDWTGSPKTSTESITTLNNFSTSYDYTHFAVIIKGKGLGQSRRIISYNGSSISLEEPWNVIPDTSSVITLGNFVDRTVLYKNFIDGKAYAVTESTLNASAGIQPFGGMSNFIADNNTIQEVRAGLSNWETQLNVGLDPNFFSFFANNKISNCRWGILNGLDNTKPAGTGILGTTYRNNSIINSLQSGILYSILSPDTAVLDAISYEHNIFQNLTNGLSTGGDDGQPSWFPSAGQGIENQIFYKNVFNAGSSKSNNYGIKISPQFSLRENAYQGFDSVYKGTLSRPVIEAPYHVIEISGNSGGKIIDTSFTLYNSGSSNMNWSASSNSSWLTVPYNSGTIKDENSLSSIKLRADPTGLMAGTYVAYITVNVGTDSKTYSVLLTVTTNSASSYFQSKTSGNWNDIKCWQSSADSLTWIDATLIPSSTAKSISILNTHTIKITDSATVDQLFIQNGGILKVAPNASLVVNDGIGDDITIAPSGSLVVQSDSTGTGRIGNSSGTISGNVTVERYLSSTIGKTYRMLSPTVNTAGGSKPYIRDNWQEGQNNTSTKTNINTVPRYGIHITGSPIGANGFDATSSGAPSLSTYVPTADSNWIPVPNTNATGLEAKKGYLVLIRGDRSENLLANNPPTSTTLRATGTVVSGTQVFAKPAGNRRTALIGNPYPCPINWSTICNDATTSNSKNFENYYIYWEPHMGSSGGYVTVNSDGTKSAVTNATTEIQPGEAFIITAKQGVVSPTLTVKENHKSTTSNVKVFRLAPIQQFFTTLYYTNTNGSRIMADAVNTVFDNGFSNDVDTNDAEEMANWEENIAINREGKLLSIEERALINVRDSLPLTVQRLKVRSYEWQFNPENFTQTNVQAYLGDKYLNLRTPINLNTVTVIPFTVDVTPASSAKDRFQVLFSSINEVLPITINSLKAFQKGAKILLNWEIQNEENVTKYEIEKSFDGKQFAKIATVLATESESLIKSYSWADVDPKDGDNYYRIKIIDQLASYNYSTIVNSKINSGKYNFDIFPNPILGNYSTIQFTNVPKGLYLIKLMNSTGQVVSQKTIYHNGGSSNQNIPMEPNLPGGNYIIQITGNGTLYNKQLIK